MREMARAFDFHLACEENIRGRSCWILDANPKPGYKPSDRDARVLIGMIGRLWIDKRGYRWVHTQAEVVKPVSFYGFLAKVGPGTRIIFE